MTTEIATRPPNSNYTDAEIELGLRVVAQVSGNTRRAAKLLEDNGSPIPRSTLKEWRSRHESRYLQIQEEIMPATYARMAEQAEDIADRAAQLEGRIIHRIGSELDEIPTAKLPASLLSLTTAKAINADKSLTLRGRPTSITATADVTELLKGLTHRLHPSAPTQSVVAPPSLVQQNEQGTTPSSGTSEPKP